MNDDVLKATRRYSVRRDILAALTHAQAVDDLAAAIGKTDARVLWHLDQMVNQGLVARVADGRRWQRTPFGADVAASTPSAAQRRAFPESIVRDFEDALLEVDDGLYGDNSVQASGEHRTRLSTGQAAAFRDRLLNLVSEYFAPGNGDRTGVKYGFHWILTPIDLHPFDDPDPSEDHSEET